MSDPTKIPIAFNPQIKRMVGRTVQGGMQFDVPFITQVADNLWQGGCTNGLILPTHINYVVSLYPWERYTIKHKVRGELYIRMYDDPNQATDQIDDLAKQVNEWRARGQVLVHCQAGLNRSSVVVARALMLSGMTANDAINLLREKRSPACLCNKGFENWLRSLES
jgi:protein-tyrosine phosphatase